LNGKKVKILPKNISELLTDVAITYWLKGDGYYHKINKHIIFSTKSFTLDDVIMLQNCLTEKGIYSTIQCYNKLKHQYVIYIIAKVLSNLINIVLPYLLNIMYYKIGF
jgi:hypothetical protein